MKTKKMTFLMRTRMSKFNENFRSGKTETACPICLKHSDSQALLLECPIIKKELEIRFGPSHLQTIENIYKENIDEITVKTVKYAMDVREKKLF